MESGSECRSPKEEVVGGVGSALVGLTMRGVLAGEYIIDCV